MMNRFILSLLLVSVTLISLAIAIQQPNCIESTTLQVCFNTDGQISTLYDLLGQRDMLGEGINDIFYTEFNTAVGTPEYNNMGFASSSCQEVNIQKTENNDDDATIINITFTQCGYAVFGGGNITALVQVQRDPTDTTNSSLRWDLSFLHIPINWSVNEIHFPEVQLWIPPDVYSNTTFPSSDRLFHCTADGVLLTEPTKTFFLMDGDYPGNCDVQFITRYDNISGIIMMTKDTQANVKHFIAWTNPAPNNTRTFTMYPYHVFPYGPNQTVTSIPYSTVWRSFLSSPSNGSSTTGFRIASDIYKEWAYQQWFVQEAGSVTNSTRVPSWLIEGSALLMTQIQGPDGYNATKYGPNLELFASTAETYRELLNISHFVLIPMGWEQNGAWAGIFYFPSIPSDNAWLTTTASLQTNGNLLGTMVSGFWFVQERNTTQWGPAFNNTPLITTDIQNQLNIAVDGTVWNENFYPNTTNGELWRGYSTRLCHGSDRATNTLANVFTYANQNLGSALISFDQEIGGGQISACYEHHGEHVHHQNQLGVGPWMYQGIVRTVQTIRSQQLPNAKYPIGLCTEQTGELLLPLLSTSHTYMTAICDWPWDAVYGTGPAVFAYLYHEIMPTIGLPAGDGGNDNDNDTIYLVRQNFVNALVRGLLLETGDYFILPNASTTMGYQNVLQAGLTPAFASYTKVYGRFPQILLTSTLVEPPLVTGTSIPSTYYPTSTVCVGDPPIQAGNGHFFSSTEIQAFENINGNNRYVLDKHSSTGRRLVTKEERYRQRNRRIDTMQNFYRKKFTQTNSSVQNYDMDTVYSEMKEQKIDDTAYYVPLCAVSSGGFWLTNATEGRTNNTMGPILVSIITNIDDIPQYYNITLDTWIKNQLMRYPTQNTMGEAVNMVTLYDATNGTIIQQYRTVPSGTVNVIIGGLGVHLWSIELN